MILKLSLIWSNYWSCIFNISESARKCLIIEVLVFAKAEPMDRRTVASDVILLPSCGVPKNTTAEVDDLIFLWSSPLRLEWMSAFARR